MKIFYFALIIAVYFNYPSDGYKGVYGKYHDQVQFFSVKGVEIPNDLDININYLAVSNLTKLTQDEINLYNFYLNKNIMSIVDLTKMLTNAKYDSDVLEMLEKNKEINNLYLTEIVEKIQEKEIEETI